MRRWIWWYLIDFWTWSRCRLEVVLILFILNLYFKVLNLLWPRKKVDFIEIKIELYLLLLFSSLLTPNLEFKTHIIICPKFPALIVDSSDDSAFPRWKWRTVTGSFCDLSPFHLLLLFSFAFIFFPVCSCFCLLNYNFRMELYLDDCQSPCFAFLSPCVLMVSESCVYLAA